MGVMKNKEKQIEEIGNKLDRYCIRAKCRAESCGKCRARWFIRNGYRKVGKDSVVLSKEDYQLWNILKKTWASNDKEISAENMLETLKNTKELGSKETAEKFKTSAIKVINRYRNCDLIDAERLVFELNNIAKQLGVLLKE